MGWKFGILFLNVYHFAQTSGWDTQVSQALDSIEGKLFIFPITTVALMFIAKVLPKLVRLGADGASDIFLNCGMGLFVITQVLVGLWRYEVIPAASTIIKINKYGVLIQDAMGAIVICIAYILLKSVS